MTEHTPPQPASINSRIAARVRGLRTERGLTLEALAEISGVSRSMLSVVERGESSPTAIILEKIATGLGVPLAALFNNSNTSVSPLSTRKERSSWQDPQSGYVRCNISPANFPSPIQIVEVTLPAGAHVAYESGARRSHIHQQIWVQSGHIEICIGRKTQRLNEGDCYAMRLDQPNSFRNPTRKPARYYVVIATEIGSQ